MMPGHTDASLAQFARRMLGGNRSMKTLRLAVIGSLLFPGLCFAGFQEGVQAYDAGKYTEAAREFRTGADRGEASSLHRLGNLYELGLGVPQSYLRAHFYYNLAGARGNADAIAARDALSQRMSADQVARAQELALEWAPKDEPVQPSVSTAGGTISPARETEGSRDATISWSSNNSAAWQAILGDENDRLKQLLESGVDPNTYLSTGETLLIEAVRNSSPRIVETLLVGGADPNLPSTNGWTPLKVAIYVGRTGIARRLLSGGADPSVKRPDGMDALALAQQLGHADLVRVLGR
jgi:hypothetical protein